MPVRNKRNGRFVSSAYGGIADPMVANQVARVVENALLSRSELMNQHLDPRRNIDEECGYPSTENLTADAYRRLYDREAIAARVVQLLPIESWKTQPSVFEDEDADSETEFEAAWAEVSNSLRGEHSWYQSEQGSPVWEYLLRGDVLSGIGRYGVLLLGLDDGEDLEQPASKKNQRLLFVRAFDESLAQIAAFEGDPSSPRFGQPNMYSLTFSDPTEPVQSSAGVVLATKNVHWTRVVHLADDLGSSEIFAAPRMRPVYNRLMDLRKLYSGSAEMYWRGAFPGFSLETHPQLGGDVDIDEAAMRTEAEKMFNGLQRLMISTGMSAKSLAPQVVDPTPQINVQIEAICIKLAVPKRVFTGSERGELASSQDSAAWNDRLQDRQNMYLTPRVIVPFVDRLILLGILPEPVGYSIVWPDLNTLSEQEQAQVAVSKTEALAKYVDGNVESLVPPLEYFVQVLGMEQKQAESLLEAAMEQVEKDNITAPLEPELPPGMEKEEEGKKEADKSENPFKKK